MAEAGIVSIIDAGWKVQKVCVIILFLGEMDVMVMIHDLSLPQVYHLKQIWKLLNT